MAWNADPLLNKEMIHLVSLISPTSLIVQERLQFDVIPRLCRRPSFQKVCQMKRFEVLWLSSRYRCTLIARHFTLPSTDITKGLAHVEWSVQYVTAYWFLEINAKMKVHILGVMQRISYLSKDFSPDFPIFLRTIWALVFIAQTCKNCVITRSQRVIRA